MPRRQGRSWAAGAAETAREIARATATTAGRTAAGSSRSDRVTTDSAATVPCRWSVIGQATDVIGSGCRRDATATPSRRTAASWARRSRPDSVVCSGSRVRSPARILSWTGAGAWASRTSPTPVECSGIRPPTRYSTRPAPCADGEQHVLAGGLMQVLQVGQRGGAQPVPAWRQRRDLQQPQPDHVTAVPGALQGPPLDEFAGQAQGAGLGQAGPGTQRRQGQRAVPGAERPEYPEGPVQHRLAPRGAPPPSPGAAGP